MPPLLKKIIKLIESSNFEHRVYATNCLLDNSFEDRSKICADIEKHLTKQIENKVCYVFVIDKSKTYSTGYQYQKNKENNSRNLYDVRLIFVETDKRTACEFKFHFRKSRVLESLDFRLINTEYLEDEYGFQLLRLNPY